MLEDKIKLLAIKSLKDCVIVIKTSWAIFWGTEKYYNNYNCPHLSECVAKFLLKHNISGLGIDTLSPDCMTGNCKCIVHEILLSNNI